MSGGSNPLLSLLGAATKGVGAYNASSSQRSSLEYQASVASNNAILDQDKASIADQNGQIAVENQDLKTGQILGMQKANLGANGVVLNQGSAANLQASTELMGQRDANQLQLNSMREAWGYGVQGQEQTANAGALRSMAGSISPDNAAMTSLLGSASQVAPAWRNLVASTSGGGGGSNTNWVAQ